MSINHELINNIRVDSKIMGKGDVVKKYNISYSTLKRISKEHKIKFFDKRRCGRPKIEYIKQ